jgi:hypothetical protein
MLLLLYLAVLSPAGRNLYPYFGLDPHWLGKDHLLKVTSCLFVNELTQKTSLIALPELHIGYHLIFFPAS